MSGVDLGDGDMALVIRGQGNTEIYLPVIENGTDMARTLTALVLFWASSHPTAEKARADIFGVMKECGL